MVITLGIGLVWWFSLNNTWLSGVRYATSFARSTDLGEQLQ